MLSHLILIGEKMKLWFLYPNEVLPLGDNPWEPWYDKVFSLVIRAPSEAVARQYAHTHAGEENKNEFLDRIISNTTIPWLDSKYSVCEELLPEGKPGVIIKNFNSTG